jgi:excisionase family DNA binding protein
VRLAADAERLFIYADAVDLLCEENMNEALLLTADETARLLRTSRRAIYLMVERHQLPGVTRIGPRLLFSRTDLLHWLDQKRTPSLKE